METKKNTESKTGTSKKPYKGGNYKKNTEENTKVENNTAKRPEKDTNPLPPNPNKVDNH